ncbi:MAG: hypothetical protein ACHQXG_03280 [Nitrososphaerales archaeon]|jgi:hypothetical protein
MEKITRKDLNNSPDETRSFDKGRVDVGKLDEYIIGKPQFEAGWSWEKYVKPIATSGTTYSIRNLGKNER